MIRPGLFLALVLAGAAQAQECRMPRAHERFEGVVVSVIDGDTLRMATRHCPALHVRFADFDAPELREPGGQTAKIALTVIALGRPIHCQSAKGRRGNYRSYGRAMARCSVAGASIADSMRRMGISEGGR